MDAIAALPPYAHINKEAVQCVAQASLRYEVPELLLHAILVKENGRMGKCTKNKDGTYDCGLAQINTSWTQQFARQGVRMEHLVYDTCTNIQASAYILKANYLKKNRDWFSAIVAYNIGPNNWTPSRYAVGQRYGADVVRNWWGFQNWVDASQGISRAAPASMPATAPQAVKSRGTLRKKEAPHQLVFSTASEAATSQPALNMLENPAAEALASSPSLP